MRRVFTILIIAFAIFSFLVFNNHDPDQYENQADNINTKVEDSRGVKETQDV